MSRGVRFAARGAWLFPGLRRVRLEEDARPAGRLRRVVLAVVVAAGGLLVLAHGCHRHDEDTELFAGPGALGPGAADPHAGGGG
jgi:hypothetical protein